MGDAYIQREDERAWEDEQYDRRLAADRASRMAEKGEFAYPRWIAPPRPTVGYGRRLLRLLGLIAALSLAWAFAVGVAVCIFLAVAWALS